MRWTAQPVSGRTVLVIEHDARAGFHPLVFERERYVRDEVHDSFSQALASAAAQNGIDPSSWQLEPPG